MRIDRHVTSIRRQVKGHIRFLLGLVYQIEKYIRMLLGSFGIFKRYLTIKSRSGFRLKHK